MKTGREAPGFRAAKRADPTPMELALRALAFLSRDDSRSARFFALTGLDAGHVPALIRDPGFHLAILDHFAGDEALLLDFASAESLSPEAVGRARLSLNGKEQTSA
jgi:hypothetical protein